MKAAMKSIWFSHDANAQDDEDILELRAKFGWEGYGLFWAIIERMRSAPDYKLKKDRMEGLSLGLSYPIAPLSELIECCCKLGLFSCDDTHFWSDSLVRRMQGVDDAKAAAKEAGRRGAAKRWAKAEKKPVFKEDGKEKSEDSLAIAPLKLPHKANHSDPIAIKEKKSIEKKNKEEEKSAPAQTSGFANSVDTHVKPSLEDVVRYAEVQGIPRETAESFFDHYDPDDWFTVKYDANGQVTSRKPIHDWSAKLRQWHRRDQTSGVGNGRATTPASPYHPVTGWARTTTCPKTGRPMVIDTMKLTVGSSFPYKYADGATHNGKPA